MAGNRWQVQVRRDAHHPATRTFTLKRDAEPWARRTEARLERGEEALNAPAVPNNLEFARPTHLSGAGVLESPNKNRGGVILQNNFDRRPLARITRSTRYCPRDIL
jgi:hypothetical protein